MKTLKKRMSMQEYKEVYIKNVLQHLSDNYVINKSELRDAERSFERSFNKDSNHVLHFTSDYWADFIADARELKRKNKVTV